MPGLSPINLDNYKPLREVVFEVIRTAITSGTLQPGERIMENQLAEQLNVSRTPVREAIRKLEQEGFVVMVPRRGTYVSDLSIRDINEVFEIRTALEVLAAGLAAERITEDGLELLERLLVEIGELIDLGDTERLVEADCRFHDILYNATHNKTLANITNNLREKFTPFRAISYSYPGRAKRSLEEHRRLVEALAERNPLLAQQVARKHMEKAEQTLLQHMSEHNLQRHQD
ncbi:MAG: GntR family transcriptional regulator [Negativicutes bacterium]|nr:GntR family transcriptional regulator [Negativicutes bacterium]